MRYLINVSVILLFFISQVSGQNNTTGNALKYNDTTCVSYGNTDFSFADKVTVMGWVKWEISPDNGNDKANLVAFNSVLEKDEGQFWLRNGSNNGKFEFVIATKKQNGKIQLKTARSSTKPLQGTWYHLAGVYDGSTLKIYVNGLIEQSVTFSGIIFPLQNDYVLTTGRWAHPSDNHKSFNGIIDEVSIWNKALSSQEIQSSMSNNLIGNETGLKAYYMYNEVPGDSIVDDTSPSQYDGINGSTGTISMAISVVSTIPLAGTLPVELLHFTPLCGKSNAVTINWATASETNNDYFTIYRSHDYERWEFVADIDGAGNSNDVTEYTIDAETPPWSYCYYKMVQTDFDGKTEEFDIKVIYCKTNMREIILYPNPADLNITFSFRNVQEIEAPITVNIYNSSGQHVSQQKFESNNGTNDLLIALESIESGTYYLQILLDKQFLYTGPIIINH